MPRSHQANHRVCGFVNAFHEVAWRKAWISQHVEPPPRSLAGVNPEKHRLVLVGTPQCGGEGSSCSADRSTEQERITAPISPVPRARMRAFDPEWASRKALDNTLSGSAQKPLARYFVLSMRQF